MGELQGEERELDEVVCSMNWREKVVVSCRPLMEVEGLRLQVDG